MFDQPHDDTPVGVSAGHWTNAADRTGCTVVLFDRPAPAVLDVRGGAPGTRETALLGPGDLVQSVDAILLTGGSAFGLGAADGVMRFLADRGRGVSTAAMTVPIVPAAVLFDLAVGNPTWPTAEHGYAAAESAVPLPDLPRGPVGAGSGATTAKMFGAAEASAGGIGVGRCDIPGGGAVAAIVAVNAAGAVVTDTAAADPRLALLGRATSPSERTSTTLAVVVVDAPTDERTLRRAAISAHDGMARRIFPCHTLFDGDVVFAVGLRRGTVAPVAVLATSVAAELAVERAIVDAIDAAHRG